MKKKIFTIEFLGMPGSGKSYIQKVILKNLKLKNYYNYYNDYKILNRFSKILFFLQFFIIIPYFFAKNSVSD